MTDQADSGGIREPELPVPGRRRLRVFGFDPLSTRMSRATASGGFITVSVPMEPVECGPVGRLVHVADVLPGTDNWLWPVDLDHSHVLQGDGLTPSEADPRSHQQMVYAVASSVIERFERYLGRRFKWKSSERLVLVPHAFEGRNAFFDPVSKAVMFGYFTATPRDGDPVLVGQRIFTCLSMDIIAHEVAHALVHRLRDQYIYPTNPDVLAWHEAFADLVALFHHFVFEEVVRDAVSSSRSDLAAADGLFDLALEFGSSIGRGAALRSAIADRQATGDSTTARRPFHELNNPHERGAAFVAAVFDAYIATYRRKIADLLRIATAGTGVLPPGHLHPDLVARVAGEAMALANRFMGIVIRAFDYLPAVDVTFGDVIRAIVTSDRDLFPDDDAGLRANLVEAFRHAGIVPDGVSSLADESLAWPNAQLQLPNHIKEHLPALVGYYAAELDPTVETGDLEQPKHFAAAIAKWAGDNPLVLGLHPDKTVKLAGRHVSFREAQDRQPRPEIIVQFTQRRQDLEAEVPGTGDSLPLRAGTTLVINMKGDVRYSVNKPLPLNLSTNSPLTQLIDTAGRARLERIKAHLADQDRSEPTAMWRDPSQSGAFQRLHLAGEP